jgi:hypothetical protein
MSGKNIHTIEANHVVDPTTAFEAAFSPLAIDEVLLEFDSEHPGPPLIVLTNDAGTTKEIHPLPQRGREGRFAAHTEGSGSWSKIRVLLGPRGKKAKLVRIKLIAKGAT